MTKKEQERLMNVTFVSEWNHNQLIETNAKFNWATGEVVEIEPSNEKIEGICTKQFIQFADGIQLEIDNEEFEEDVDIFVQHEVIFSSDGTEKGYIIGEDDEADCGVESCNGTNYQVYWENGEISICCGKGLASVEENVYKILG